MNMRPPNWWKGKNITEPSRSTILHLPPEKDNDIKMRVEERESMLNFVENMNTFIESRSLPVTSFSKDTLQDVAPQKCPGSIQIYSSNPPSTRPFFYLMESIWYIKKGDSLLELTSTTPSGPVTSDFKPPRPTLIILRITDLYALSRREGFIIYVWERDRSISQPIICRGHKLAFFVFGN